MPSVRSASGASDANSRSNLQVGSLPAGWQPGDLVFIVIGSASTQSSWSDNGTGWTYIRSGGGDANTGGGGLGSNICWRIMQAGDTWPGNTSGTGLRWSSSNRYSVTAICIQPDAGQTFTSADIGTDASPVINTTAATSHTPPAYSAGSDTGLSVLLNAARAFNNGATAITTTPPASWTEPAGGDNSTASGTNANSRQVSTSVSARADQTGTITPGSETIAGGVANGTVTANLYHLFIKGVPAAPTSFPVVVNSATTNSNSLSSQALTMPASIVAGNLLLAHAFNNPGGTPSISGWTQVGTFQAGSSLNYTVFAKTAVGGDTATITYGANAGGGTIVYQISNWSGSIADVASAFSSNAAPGNPPSLDMGSSRDHLWFAGTAGSLVAPTAAPANYTDLSTGGASTLFGTAYRSLTAASEDPGAFTGGAGTVITGTTAVPPAAALTTTSASFLPFFM
jgi:hypothetical protein